MVVIITYNLEDETGIVSNKRPVLQRTPSEEASSVQKIGTEYNYRLTVQFKGEKKKWVLSAVL